MDARRWLIRRSKRAVFLHPWIQHFLSPSEEPDAWMNPPTGLELIDAGTTGAQQVILPFVADPGAQEVLIDSRDAPTNSSGWHAARVWLKVSRPSPAAEVMIGDYLVGRTELPSGMADELLQSGLVPTGTLEVRVIWERAQVRAAGLFVQAVVLPAGEVRFFS